MLDSLRRLFIEKKILVISVLVVLLILGLILGVVVYLNSRPKPKLLLSPKVDLTWWKTDTKPSNYEEIISEFKKIPGNNNVNIKIEEKKLDDQYYRNLITDIARGIGPDIFTLQNNDLPAYKEFLSPIDVINGAALTTYRDDFVNLVVRDTMDKDKVFCVSSYVDTLQLFYNEDLLRQSQIPRPATSWKELDSQIPFLRKVPASGDQFITSPIAMGIGGRSIEGKATNVPNHGDIVAALIFQYDGLIYDYQKETVALGRGVVNPNNPNTFSQGRSASRDENTLDDKSPSFEAINFYNSFADINSSRYSWNKNNPDALDMFSQGRLVYMPAYQSFYNELKQINSRINIQTATLPQRDSTNKRTFGKFNMDCLNSKLAAGAKNNLDFDAQDKYLKSQEFMQFLSSKDAQLNISKKTGLPAAHKDAISVQLKGDKFTNIFANGALNADNYYQPDVRVASQMWSDIFEKVQYNNVSLNTATQDAIRVYSQSVGSKPKLRV